ncbi:MAG TPA: adenosylcobinamide-GDP ribazoletransferase, partial [Clostridiaceae bacterium]|nr:adenosylcobinamide-GDP ribazoletransferase [Clostridiaceae bacterium]
GLSVVVFPKARDDGLAKLFADPATKQVARTLLLLVVLLGGGMIAIKGWVGLVVVLVLGLWFGQYYRFTKKRYGGMTGDLAGFFLTIAEWLMLLVLAIGTGMGW